MHNHCPPKNLNIRLLITIGKCLHALRDFSLQPNSIISSGNDTKTVSCGWGDGPVVKSIGYFCREPRFGCCVSTWWPAGICDSSSKELTSSSVLCRNCTLVVHRQNSHIHKIKTGEALKDYISMCKMDMGMGCFGTMVQWVQGLLLLRRT